VQVRQVAVALLHVEPIAHEELVGDGEADVADGEVLDQAAIGPVKERGGGERGRRAERERLAEVVEGEAGVDHVLHDEDVPVGEFGVEVFEEADAGVAARVGAGGIAGELDEVDRVRDRERAGKVGEEDEARLQRRDEQRVAPFVVVRNLAAELLDARLQLLAREVDLAEAGGDVGQLASSSR
jgi:hypothetical protein